MSLPPHNLYLFLKINLQYTATSGIISVTGYIGEDTIRQDIVIRRRHAQFADGVNEELIIVL